MRKILLMATLLCVSCDDQLPPSNQVAVDANPVDAAQPKDAATVPSEAKPAQPAHACEVQNGVSTTHRLKALGTEPFWAGEVHGRCVTYKTPADQQGTRIWTHVENRSRTTVWNGALNSKEFRLEVRPAQGGCSDGMSDKTYPWEAVLRVEGELRKGCAEPL